MLQCGKPFSRVIHQYTKFANFRGLHFPHFNIFCNQTSQFYYIKGALSNYDDKFSQLKSLSNRGMVSDVYFDQVNWWDSGPSQYSEYMQEFESLRDYRSSMFIPFQITLNSKAQTRTGLCATVSWHMGPYWGIKWALDNCCLISVFVNIQRCLRWLDSQNSLEILCLYD